MSWLSSGSLALPLLLSQQNTALKRQVSDLSQALSSGTVTRVSSHLRGDLVVLSGIDSRLANLDSYAAAITGAETDVSLILNALETISTVSAGAAKAMLSSSSAQSASAVETGAHAARASLEGFMSALSVQSAGRALFSGQNPASTPFGDPADLLSALTPLLSAATSADEVATLVEQAITSPGTLFSSTLYRGGDAASGALIDTETALPALPTAQDTSLRRMLGALAMASLAADPALSLSTAERSALIAKSGEEMLSVAPALAVLQGQVGSQLGTIETTQTRQTSERNALSLQRSALVGADPYETAAALTERQTQLETLYALTARVSRLSLAAYLR